MTERQEREPTPFDRAERIAARRATEVFTNTLVGALMEQGVTREDVIASLTESQHEHVCILHGLAAPVVVRFTVSFDAKESTVQTVLTDARRRGWAG